MVLCDAWRAPDRPRRRRPNFHDMVASYRRIAGLPMPKVYIMDNPQPNAFATGRNPEHAAVAATTGLSRALSREEIAGVMAHELAHVKNRDTLIMTMTATDRRRHFHAGQFRLVLGRRATATIRSASSAPSLIIIVAPLAAMLVQMAISRTREYDADRIGAEISGKPMALASALARDLERRAPHREPHGGSQSGDRTYVHHQSARRVSAWTICFPPTPRPKTASPPCGPWCRRWARRLRRSPSAGRGARRCRWLTPPASRSAASPSRLSKKFSTAKSPSMMRSAPCP